jgi:hypothetical protein
MKNQITTAQLKELAKQDGYTGYTGYTKQSRKTAIKQSDLNKQKARHNKQLLRDTF